MKRLGLFIGLTLTAASSALAANPDKDAAKAVIKAVNQGDDLALNFPGAISATDVASLKRVTKCSGQNLMRQSEGYYTVVWDCGSSGALGMKIVVNGGKIISISTMEIEMRPNSQ